MTTWKNILTDPPTPGTGIRATDGKSVFVGHIMQNVPWFTGVSMDDGSEITISTDHLTEWMPMTAPEREKTADEMFRELGYTKRNTGMADVTQYDNEFLPYFIRFINGAVYKFHEGYGRDGFTQGEVLACARLIEEMEDNDELD